MHTDGLYADDGRVWDLGEHIRLFSCRMIKKDLSDANVACSVKVSL